MHKNKSSRPLLFKPTLLVGALSLAMTACVATLTPVWKTGISADTQNLVNLHTSVAVETLHDDFLFSSTDAALIPLTEPELGSLPSVYRAATERGKVYSVYRDEGANQIYITQHDPLGTLLWTSTVIQEDVPVPGIPQQYRIHENGDGEIWLTSTAVSEVNTYNGSLRIVRLSSNNGGILSNHIARNVIGTIDTKGVLNNKLIVLRNFWQEESNGTAEVEAFAENATISWHFNPTSLDAFKNTKASVGADKLEVKGNSIYWAAQFQDNQTNPTLFVISNSGALKWQYDLSDVSKVDGLPGYPLEVECEEINGTTYLAKETSPTGSPNVSLAAHNSLNGTQVWSQSVSLPAVQYPVVAKPLILDTRKELKETAHINLKKSDQALWLLLSETKQTSWVANIFTSSGVVAYSWAGLTHINQYSFAGKALNTYQISGSSSQFVLGDEKSFYTAGRVSGDKTGALYLNKFTPK